MLSKVVLRVKRLISYIELYLWWVKSYEVRDRTLVDLSRDVAKSLNAKPFRKIRIAYREDIINAAAIGLLCRTLVISQGMVSALTLDELRAVILHEYAHCIRKHHLKLLAATLSITIIGALPLLHLTLYTELGSEALLAITGVSLTSLYIITLITTKYLARRFEEEADIVVVRSLGDPKSYFQLLQKLAVRSPVKRYGLRERLFSSHPPIAERLRKLYRCVGSG